MERTRAGTIHLITEITRVDPDLRDGLAEIYIRCLTYAYGALPCLGGSGWLMCIEEKYSELENFIFLISS